MPNAGSPPIIALSEVPGPLSATTGINIFNLGYVNKCKKNRLATAWKASMCARDASISKWKACIFAQVASNFFYMCM